MIENPNSLDKKNKKGLTRRESLKLGAAAVVGVAALGAESVREKDESDAISEIRQEKTASHILHIFPQGDALVQEYAARHKANEHSVDVMRDVLYTALDQALANSALYHSETLNSGFPYTRLNLNELAQKLYAGQTKIEQTKIGPIKAEKDEKADTSPTYRSPRARREFITTGIPIDIDSGGQFEWIEVALHSLLESIPYAIKDIEEGRTTEDSEVYILGYPTNEYGSVSSELSDALQTEGLAALGKLYAEFIQKQTASLATDPNAVVALTGISLGASIAAEIGSELVKGNAASQEEAIKRKAPRLRVALYSPAGVSDLNTSPERTAQMETGLAAEAAYNAAFNTGTQTISGEMPEFLKESRRVLADTMVPQINPEQKNEKEKALHTMRRIALKGTPIPKDLKVTEVVGVYDPLLYSEKHLDELKQGTQDHRGSLGQGLLQRTSEDERVFGVHMSHQPPYYLENEFKRYDRIVRSLDSIRDI